MSEMVCLVKIICSQLAILNSGEQFSERDKDTQNKNGGEKAEKRNKGLTNDNQQVIN